MLVTLFGTALSAEPKPKTIVLYKSADKTRTVEYTGIVSKKIPMGEGKLKVINRDKPESIVLSGIFNESSVTEAKLSIAQHQAFNCEKVDYIISDNLIEYKLTNAKFSDERQIITIPECIISYSLTDLTLKTGQLYSWLERIPVRQQIENSRVVSSLPGLKIKYVELSSFANCDKVEMVIYAHFSLHSNGNGLYISYDGYEKDAELCWSDNTITGIKIQGNSKPQTITDVKEFRYSLSNNAGWDNNYWCVTPLEIHRPNGDSLVCNKNKWGDIVTTELLKTFNEGKYHWQADRHLKIEDFPNYLPDSLAYYSHYHPDLRDGNPNNLEWRWSSPTFYNLDPRNEGSMDIYEIYFDDGGSYVGITDNETPFSFKSPLYRTGLLIRADGSRIIYIGGKPETEQDFIRKAKGYKCEIEAEYARRLAEKEEIERQEREEEERITREMTSKYGKYYKAWNEEHIVLVGTPLEMLKQVTTVTLELRRNDFNVYFVYYGNDYAEYVQCSVSASTKKVTDIRPNPWGSPGYPESAFPEWKQ